MKTRKGIYNELMIGGITMAEENILNTTNDESSSVKKKVKAEVAPSSDQANVNLSENFTLEEFTFSNTVKKSGQNILNVPSKKEIASAVALCENVLQKVRDKFGPTHIYSGYRNQQVNKLVGGSPNSQHMKGEAADIAVKGYDNYKIACWIRDNLEFDQLILEFRNPEEFGSGWIHVSYSEGNNRKESLTATLLRPAHNAENNRVVYKKGLVR